MGLFNRRPHAEMAVSRDPEITAAVGYGRTGAGQIGNFIFYQDGDARAKAVSIPTISRARDLIASMVGCLPLKFYRLQWNGTEMEKVYIAPRAWAARIDPTVTNNFILSWTFDDLYFFGRAFWHVTSRTQDGYPSAFTRLPAAMITTLDQAGPIWFGPSQEIMFNGFLLDPNDIVQMLSPIQGLLTQSPAAINTALKLQHAADRNASSALPAGVLKQTSGEPLSGQELADLAQRFNEARYSNQTAALSESLSYEATTATPDKMLLVESRQFQSLELSRVANIPPYLAGIAVGGYTYQNASMAKQDLYLFAAKNYIVCINEYLSSDNVLPHGTYVELDVESYLTDLVATQDEIVNVTVPTEPQPALANIGSN